MKRVISMLMIMVLALLAFAITGCTSEPAVEEGAAIEERTTIEEKPTAEEEHLNNNILTVAVAWKQTAAEYKALYYQGYNIAKLKVDEALENWKVGDKPLAVVTDMDDTIMSPVNYWGYCIENDIDFFDDPIWDRWIPENKMIPTPGALDFFNYCEEKGVEVYYVTSRNQGEKTYDYALTQLQIMGFPYADTDHLTVLTDTSNKEKVHVELKKNVDFAVYLGDSLNDFNRSYYIKDVDEREVMMEKTKDLYGDKYILFPNPTDGHWVSAIFGESEPPANNENRLIWKDAAMRSKWEE